MLKAIRIFSILAIACGVLAHLYVWGWLPITGANHWWADGIWWRFVSFGLVCNAVGNILLAWKRKP